ncbi:MAG TPA: hypothetical protein PKC57_10025, partial [Microthrixaceae bacterium]|nr:hypothetical protein [Microthrixaceae bacterium]
MAIPLHRSSLLDDRSCGGRGFCDRYTQVVEDWLRSLWVDAVAAAGGGDGMALVAVGGQGRGELCPGSDLDLLLLADKGVDAARVADGLWYPIWDERLKLGHAVRSIRDTLALAAEDLETATALLSARHVAGDPALTAELAEKARLAWQRKGRRWLDVLSRAVQARHAAHGEVAFDLEPDLKEGRGGLRDVHALAWARAAGADVDERLLAELFDHHDALLAVRVELHRAGGRAGDVLTLDDQDDVAARLGDVDEITRVRQTPERHVVFTHREAERRADEAVRAEENDLAFAFRRRADHAGQRWAHIRGLVRGLLRRRRGLLRRRLLRWRSRC